MSQVNPPRVPSPANCIRDAIERVAYDSIDSLDSRYSEGLDQQVGYVVRHELNQLSIYDPPEVT